MSEMKALVYRLNLRNPVIKAASGLTEGECWLTEKGQITFTPAVFSYVFYQNDGWGRMVQDPCKIIDLRTVKERTSSVTKFLRWIRNQLKDVNVDSMYYDHLKRDVTTLKNMTDADIQVAQDFMIAKSVELFDTSSLEFDIVQGEAIVEAYKYGPDSCMKGKIGQLALYVQNPERIKLVKIMREGKYVGRALQWTADDGRILLDRIYPGNGILSQQVRAKAKKLGWMVTVADSIGVGNQIDTLEVTLRHPNNGRIAYLDTLAYVIEATEETLTLTNSTANLTYGTYTSVGDYEGRCTFLYGDRSSRFTNGKKAVRLFDRGQSINTNRFYFVVYKKSYGHDVAGVNRVLDRTGSYVCIPSESYAVYPSSIFRVIDGKFYHKKDTRKVRNSEAYVPKPDVRFYEITDSVIHNKGNVIELKVGV